jgi:hypothetical protein
VSNPPINSNFQVLSSIQTKSGETFTWAQAQHLLFGRTHIILRNLNIKGLINDS